jgi:hypothetical protein
MNTRNYKTLIQFSLALLTGLCLTACTDLSDDAETPSNFSCDDGFPKAYGNQKFNTLQIDVFHYEEGRLEYVRSIFPRIEFPNRSITLDSAGILIDTYEPNVSISYTIENGCIQDGRTWQRLRINDDCTSITSETISVGVRNNGISYIDGVFDCSKADSTVINEALEFFKGITTFDSVYIDRRSEELSLIE